MAMADANVEQPFLRKCLGGSRGSLARFVDDYQMTSIMDKCGVTLPMSTMFVWSGMHRGRYRSMFAVLLTREGFTEDLVTVTHKHVPLAVVAEEVFFPATALFVLSYACYPRHEHSLRTS